MLDCMLVSDTISLWSRHFTKLCKSVYRWERVSEIYSIKGTRQSLKPSVAVCSGAQNHKLLGSNVLVHRVRSVMLCACWHFYCLLVCPPNKQMRFHIVSSVISETMQSQARLALAYAAVDLRLIWARDQAYMHMHTAKHFIHASMHANETKLFQRDCPQTSLTSLHWQLVKCKVLCIAARVWNTATNPQNEAKPCKNQHFWQIAVWCAVCIIQETLWQENTRSTCWPDLYLCRPLDLLPHGMALKAICVQEARRESSASSEPAWWRQVA